MNTNDRCLFLQGYGLHMVKTKRAYEKPEPDDGLRVLVDRLWPRGVSRGGAAIDRWEREIAPSDELRRWFAHDPGRWQEFRNRYLAELDRSREVVQELAALSVGEQVTLVYAARDEQHNNAVVLKELIDSLCAGIRHGDEKRRREHG